MLPGWVETVKHNRSSQWQGSGAAAAAAELDEYLEKMGVR